MDGVGVVPLCALASLMGLPFFPYLWFCAIALFVLPFSAIYLLISHA